MNVPLGFPSPMCIHLDWVKVGQEKLKDQYKSFAGFNKCSNSQDRRIRWYEQDPTDGVDLYSFK